MESMKAQAGSSASSALIPMLFFAAIGIAVIIGFMLQPEQAPLKDCGRDFACFSTALKTCERASYRFDDDNLIVIASIRNSSEKSADRCMVSYSLKDYDCPSGMGAKECQAISMMRSAALKMNMGCWLNEEDAKEMHESGHFITSAAYLGACQGNLKEYVPVLTGNRLH